MNFKLRFKYADKGLAWADPSPPLTSAVWMCAPENSSDFKKALEDRVCLGSPENFQPEQATALVVNAWRFFFPEQASVAETLCLQMAKCAVPKSNETHRELSCLHLICSNMEKKNKTSSYTSHLVDQKGTRTDAVNTGFASWPHWSPPRQVCLVGPCLPLGSQH
jgi:hypothetical protein